MLESVWLALYATAVVFTVSLFALKREAVITSLLTTGMWIAVAFGAQGITVVTQDGSTVTSQETTLTVFGVGMMTYSVLMLVLSLFGGENEDDSGESTVPPTSARELQEQLGD